MPLKESSAVPWIKPQPPTFSSKQEERQFLKGRLALAFRIFSLKGYEEGLAGHITVKGPYIWDPIDTKCFWVNPFGVPWRRMKASDLILVNSEGKVVDGGAARDLNSGAYMIHHAIHVARPEVICVAHAHTIYGRAFSCLGKPLDIINQDSCAFHKDQAYQGSFTGATVTEGPGKVIAETLGPAQLIVLQNHGLLTVGTTVESATFWFIAADRCCEVQLLAEAAASGTGTQTLKVDDEDAQRSHDTVGSEELGWFAGKPSFEALRKEDGDEYLE